MSREGLTAFLALVEKDAVLQSKLNEVGSLYEAAAVAQDKGFHVEWKDWARFQAQQLLSLNDEQVAEYCQRLSPGIEVFSHATFIPIFGLLCKPGAFEWVIPFNKATTS